MATYLATLGSFATYLGIAVAAVIAFFALYILVTPHREVALIRAGNTSAAIVLLGAMLGFVLPVASALSHSVALADLAAWCVVAAVVQLIGHFGVRLWLRTITADIEADRVSMALLAGGCAVGLGIVNAAAMVY
jgi:putative membrane protein